MEIGLAKKSVLLQKTVLLCDNLSVNIRNITKIIRKKGHYEHCETATVLRMQYRIDDRARIVRKGSQTPEHESLR